ncbi:MAG: peptidoglycan DD-metalloendopeptidase family protein [Ruminococcus sp.]|uniref:peptidoglycan DD-metalloendopeptidase family protein n=1 Tax=Ruminococcus sp. TaxID=41978 RepID=UPI0025F1EA23|nr:peptidoglycan DD-metalloendopeptidase family protein [Ruminococcus sp.]MCR5541255.1 peptidoglycan DD-metalloendopeptidase family protein [Ruminococcus sp.]
MKTNNVTGTMKKVISTLAATGCMFSMAAAIPANSTIGSAVLGNAVVASAAVNAGTVVDAKNGNADLVQGKFYKSPSQNYVLVFQGDGNLVIYHYNKTTDKAYSPIWSSQTENRGGTKCVLQGDGNFVIYRSDGKAIWNTQTNGKKGAYLTISDEGEIKIISRNSNNATTWSSKNNHGYSISINERPFNWPVPDCKAISSAFNDGRNHGAIDIAAAAGTSVKAAAGGTVQTYYGYNGGAGNYVVITHKINGATYLTVYMHLSQITVANGATVSAGTEIGKVGSTGNSTGPHLDFSIREGSYYGTRLDPGYYTNLPAGLYNCTNCQNYVNEINANRNKSYSLASHTHSNY